MDKFDFIDRIIALYPHTIKDRDAQYDTYKRALKTDNIDYEKLMDIFSCEYKETYPPPAAYLRELSLKCYKNKTNDKEEQKKWLNVKVYNPILKTITNTDRFPIGTSKEQMIKTYKKMFPNTNGWQIVEVS